MSEVKLYIFNDPSQKGKGAGLNESVELAFTQTETLTSEPASEAKPISPRWGTVL